MKLTITITNTSEGWNVQATEKLQDDTTFTDRIAALSFARNVIEKAEKKILDKAIND